MQISEVYNMKDYRNKKQPSKSILKLCDNDQHFFLKILYWLKVKGISSRITQPVYKKSTYIL